MARHAVAVIVLGAVCVFGSADGARAAVITVSPAALIQDGQPVTVTVTLRSLLRPVCVASTVDCSPALT